MKIMTILGSPRLKGNTAQVLGKMEALLTADHPVDRVNVISLDLRGCLGCGACRKVKDAPGCVQKDDVPGIFERMRAADLIVYATPLYCWGFTSQMKALLDRHYCLVKGIGSSRMHSLLEGKKTALLVTCGGAVEGNADCIQTVFERMNRYIGCHVVGKYIVPFCITPDGMDAKATETAQRMVRAITA